MISDFVPVVQLGAAGVLLAVLLFLTRVIVRGDLVPRATVDVLLGARDAEIVRANERATGYLGLYETERHAREIVTEQNRELIEVARTVEHVVESLRLVAEGRSGSVEP